MVLGIGVVVDDAIVVVENVERVMAEEPDLPPKRRPRRRWGRSPARSSRSRWCCCRCLCRSAFIPGLSGTLFRQFAVTISMSMLISAIIALTLSPALCAVFLRHGRSRPAGRSAGC